MPAVRKLSVDEVQTFQDRGKGVRKLTEEQYDRVLADFEIGDYGGRLCLTLARSD